MSKPIQISASGDFLYVLLDDGSVLKRYPQYEKSIPPILSGWNWKMIDVPKTEDFKANEYCAIKKEDVA